VSRTWKDNERKYYEQKWWILRWGVNPGFGRYMKRRLSKARRKAWRIRPRHALRHWEAECNWKGW